MHFDRSLFSLIIISHPDETKEEEFWLASFFIKRLVVYFFRLAVSSGRCNRRWLCACHLRNNTIPEYPDCLNSVIALIPVILTHLLLHSSLDSLWWLRWSLSSNSDRVAPDTLLAVGASFRIQLERARSTGYVSCHRWFSSTIWFETNNQSECWCYFGSQLMRIFW